MKIFLLFLLLFSALFSDSIHYIEDKNSSLNKQNILTMNNFLPYDKKNSNFGLTHSTFWLKVTMDNVTENELEKVINLSYPLLDKVILFELDNGLLSQRAITGNLIKLVPHERIEPKLTFRILLAAQSQSTYYLKIDSGAPMTLDIDIYSSAQFENYKLMWIASGIFYLAAATVIILYNLILFFFIRVRAYIYYVVFHTTFLIVVFNINGFNVQFIYHDNPHWMMFLVPFSISISSFMQAVFAYEFLEVKKYGKKSKKLMQGILAFATITIFSTMFLEYQNAIKVVNISSLLATLIPLAISIYYGIRYKSKSAKYYTLAWTFFIIGIMIEHLKNLGFIELNFFSVNAMRMGAIAEMLIISIAMADRFSNLKNENSELKYLVSTDVLTNIKNRRFFFEHTKTLLATLKRKKEDYALAMLDIDYFKAVNDKYGHANGDKVLIEFTKNISQHLREEDTFARIGGEEFVILIRANENEALILMQRLRKSIENLDIDSSKEKINITVSMGVCLFKDGDLTVDELLKQADEALYKAKKDGRNRVSVYKSSLD